MSGTGGVEVGKDPDNDPISGILRVGFRLTPTDPEMQHGVRGVLSRARAEWDPEAVMRGLSLACAGTRYHPLDVIGRGGMSLIVRAHDDVLAREVALKVMPPTLARRPELLQRFLAEARLVGGLGHPGIVPVYDLVQPEGGPPFFALKLIEGKTLGEALREDRSLGGRTLWSGVFRRICETVAYAHASGIVHRDLKPSNVMIGPFGDVSVVDWGVAHVHAIDAPTTGSVVGTAAYMSPEQAGGGDGTVGPQSDVFSLGAMLCEILTGSPPYDGHDERDVLAIARRGDVALAMERLQASGVNESLRDLVGECLAKNPADRPEDAGVVSRRVDAFVEERLSRAEAERIEAAERRARASEGRRARRLKYALSGVLIAALSAAAVVGLRLRGERLARARTTDEAVLLRIHRAGFARDQALRAAGVDMRGLRDAVADASEARLLSMAPDATEEVRSRAVAFSESLARIVEEEEITGRFLEELNELRRWTGHVDRAHELVVGFARCFGAAGFDLDEPGTSPSAAVERLGLIRDREAIVWALDEWAHAARLSHHDEGGLNARLRSICNDLERDPWRARVRLAGDSSDGAELTSLLADVDADRALESLRLLGRSLAVAGRADEAITVYRVASRRFPSAWEVHHELAIILNQTGGLTEEVAAECIRLLSMCVALRPEDGHVRGDLAVVMARRSDPSAALVALCDGLRWARGAGAEIPLAWHGLAGLLMNLGYYDPLGQVLPHALLANPGDPELELSSGVCATFSGRYEEAETILAAVALRLAEPVVLQQVVRNYREWGRYEDALRVLETTSDARMRTELSDTRALATFAAALDAATSPAPDDPLGSLQLAAVCYRRAEYARAATLFRDVVLETDETDLPRHPLMHRTHAAIAAGLAGFGLGADAGSLSQEEMEELRALSRRWFLDGIAKLEETAAGGGSIQRTVRGLAHVHATYPPLLRLRAATREAGLAEDERDAWREVDLGFQVFFAKHDGPLTEEALAELDRFLRSVDADRR